MKKFKVAALMMCFVAISFAMTSCQKAEDLIIGKWKMVKMVEGDRTITDGDGIGSTYEFKADNSFVMEYEGISANGTYAIDDDVLTLTVFGEASKSNIDKLTKKKMVLSDPDKPSDIVEFEKL